MLGMPRVYLAGEKQAGKVPGTLPLYLPSSHPAHPTLHILPTSPLSRLPLPRLTSSQETTVGPSHWAKGIPFLRASSSSWCLMGRGTIDSLVSFSPNPAYSWDHGLC